MIINAEFTSAPTNYVIAPNVDCDLLPDEHYMYSKVPDYFDDAVMQALTTTLLGDLFPLINNQYPAPSSSF